MYICIYKYTYIYIRKCKKYLQLVNKSFVIEDITITSLYDSSAAPSEPPKDFVNGSFLLQVNLREIFSNCVCCSLRFVVRNRRVKVVSDMRGSNLVMQEINKTPRIHLIINSINSMHSSLHKVVIVNIEVRYVDVRVLKPEDTSEFGL